jgi:FMN phosphatase YigB (HAD superfamily)
MGIKQFVDVSIELSVMSEINETDVFGVESEFLRLLHQSEVVSFDFFDTVVTRSVAQPTHVFAEMETRLVHRWGRSWRGFARDRFLAEASARRFKRSEVKDADVDLAEIYVQLAFLRQWSFGLRDEIAKFELEVELDVMQDVPLISKLLTVARDNQKRIIIVSDFYMSSQNIVQMAQKVGHHWLSVEDVFVSSETTGMKQNGTLWDEVLEQIKVPATKVLHIGDNFVADVQQPQFRGIKTIHYPAMHRSHRLPINTDPSVLAHSKLEATYRNRAATTEWNGARSVGATTATLIVADHVIRARKLQSENPGSSVHFVARDGWLGHQIWQDLQYENGHYLYASRLVVWRCMLKNCTEVEAREFVGKEEKLEIGRLERRLGCKLLDQNGCAMKPDFVVSADQARELIVRNAEAVVDAGRNLRVLFLHHLREQGLLDSGVHFIVDLGWRGKTIADIAELVNEETDGRSHIEGIFTGLYWDASSQLSRIPMHASAITTLDGMSSQLRLLGMMRLLEACIGAPHGSLVDFEQTETGVEPVLAESLVENESYRKYLSLVSEEALRGARALICQTHESGLTSHDVVGLAIWSSMIQVGQDPHIEELRDLGSVRHVTTLDHLGEGTPLVCTELPNPNLVTTYRTLMRHHWLQGSICLWESSRSKTLRKAAAEVRQHWPVMKREWIDNYPN